MLEPINQVVLQSGMCEPEGSGDIRHRPPARLQCGGGEAAPPAPPGRGGAGDRPEVPAAAWAPSAPGAAQHPGIVHQTIHLMHPSQVLNPQFVYLFFSKLQISPS